MPYFRAVAASPISVVELATFGAAARRMWDEVERSVVIDLIARNPTRARSSRGRAASARCAGPRPAAADGAAPG